MRFRCSSSTYPQRCGFVVGYRSTSPRRRDTPYTILSSFAYHLFWVPSLSLSAWDLLGKDFRVFLTTLKYFHTKN